MAATTEATASSSASSLTWTPRCRPSVTSGQGLLRPDRLHARCPVRGDRARGREARPPAVQGAALHAAGRRSPAPASGLFLTIWTSLKWELVTAARPPVPVIPPFVIIAFELTILLGGLASALAILILGRLPKLSRRPPTTRASRVDRFGVAVACAARPDRRGPARCCRPRAPRRCGDDEVRLPPLRCSSSAGSARCWAERWRSAGCTTCSTRSGSMPGEYNFSMPHRQRCPAAAASSTTRPRSATRPRPRRNPVTATPTRCAGAAELFTIYCTPCHGARGKGGRAGGDQVRAARRPDQSRAAEGADGRLLAELPRRRVGR